MCVCVRHILNPKITTKRQEGSDLSGDDPSIYSVHTLLNLMLNSPNALPSLSSCIWHNVSAALRYASGSIAPPPTVAIAEGYRNLFRMCDSGINFGLLHCRSIHGNPRDSEFEPTCGVRYNDNIIALLIIFLTSTSGGGWLEHSSHHHPPGLPSGSSSICL